MEISSAFDTILVDLAGGASIIWLSLVGVIVIVWDVFRNDAPQLPWIAGLSVAVVMVFELFKVSDPSSTVFFLAHSDGRSRFVYSV